MDFLVVTDCWSLASRLNCTCGGDPEHAFLEAGKFIVRKSNLLIAVWDGEDAEGVGGTGDIVRFAEKAGKPIIHLNPCTQTI